MKPESSNRLAIARNHTLQEYSLCSIVVIVEFIHADSVDALKGDPDVYYDNTLVHYPDKFPALILGDLN